MKKLLLFIIALSQLNLINAQQKETFDLLTFTAPKGWKKDTQKNLVTYTKTDNQQKKWCVIGIVKSTASKGSVEADLESEWKELAAKQYNADSMQASATQEADGWKIKAASGKFMHNNEPSAVLLTTFSGYNRCISILATTNSEQFLEAITNFVGNIDIKKPESIAASNNNIQQTNNTTQSSQPGNFKFTTSNFDDGWTATEETDWVRVTKGSINVLLHYAKEGTTISADPGPHVTNAWNILSASRYSNLENYKTAYIVTYNRPYLGMGTATEKATGKRVFVVLFRQGNSGWLEFIAPDKSSFMQQFKFDPEKIQWDSETDLVKPLAAMSAYNKFAVAASDLTGKWVSWSGSNVQYVNAYTGLDAGMGHAQSSNEIVFNANGTYKREYKGVDGNPGGGNRYYGEKNNGNAIVSNWEVQLTNSFKGETHVFAAQFEAVKGGRILHLYRRNIEEMHLYKVN
jgi:hypothetical protein